MFTPAFFVNAIFVFTRYSFSEAYEKRREKGKSISKEEITA
jgi:hypothetical protein